jgi:hypothetical protein
MSGLPIPSQHELMSKKMNAANALKDPKQIRVPLPNGRFASYDSLVDQTYIPENHTSIFADPKKFMKNPRPDCMYAWVDYKKEAAIMAKIRSGAYRPVLMEEMSLDSDIPMSAHKMGSHKGASLDMVLVYDVALVEVQPRAVAEMYKWREKLAIDRTVNNVSFQQFRDRMNQVAGEGVIASCEVNDLRAK